MLNWHSLDQILISRTQRHHQELRINDSSRENEANIHGSKYIIMPHISTLNLLCRLRIRTQLLHKHWIYPVLSMLCWHILRLTSVFACTSISLEGRHMCITDCRWSHDLPLSCYALSANSRTLPSHIAESWKARGRISRRSIHKWSVYRSGVDDMHIWDASRHSRTSLQPWWKPWVVDSSRIQYIIGPTCPINVDNLRFVMQLGFAFLRREPGTYFRANDAEVPQSRNCTVHHIAQNPPTLHIWRNSNLIVSGMLNSQRPTHRVTCVACQVSPAGQGSCPSDANNHDHGYHSYDMTHEAFFTWGLAKWQRIRTCTKIHQHLFWCFLHWLCTLVGILQLGFVAISLLRNRLLSRLFHCHKCEEQHTQRATAESSNGPVMY